MSAVWNTDAVAPSERFAFWQDAICQAVLSVAAEEGAAETFRARISSRTCGRSRFAAFQATKHSVVRSQKHVTTLTDGGYLVSLQLRGVGHIEQDDQRFVLHPNEIAILDGERPFRVNFPDDVERLVAVLPRALLDARAPWLCKMPARKIRGNSPEIDMARQHFIRLACARPELQAHNAALLAENLCNLLAIATAPEPCNSTMSPATKREAMLSIARQNLADPDLSPAMLAALCGISVRTLNLRFQEMEDSWRHWVLRNRLDACCAALEDPQQDRLTISEIVYRWGFNDLSHFNKSFRRRYGCSPSEYRRRRCACN